MINRRKLMRSIGASAVAALAASTGVPRVQAKDSASVVGLVPKDEEAEQILYELASFEARYYSEEGVAVMLACENLVDSTPPSPNALNKRFAAAFRHYANLLAELRSDLSAEDVGPVVELIAHRDFATSSKGRDE